MEPMTLGSPSGSPLPASSSYLPSYLMGEQIQNTPRSNTLSPTKGRTSLTYPQTPPSGVPQSPDFNRSNVQQKFGQGFNQQNFMNQSAINNHNTSVSGPPTQSLFDSFRIEKESLQTPVKSYNNNPVSMDDSYSAVGNLNQSGFNVSRVMSPIPGPSNRFTNITSPLSQPQYNMTNANVTQNRYDYWVTVFGFPQNAASIILSHFSQCGTIIDKVFSSQNGNWVHLRFTSRLECDKALNYNGKIIAQSLMIGVQYCNDPQVVGKENTDYNLSRVRSLTNIAYKTAQNPTDVVPSPTAPKRSTGLVNKAMDLFFGW